jgi:hypothetical protein
VLEPLTVDADRLPPPAGAGALLALLVEPTNREPPLLQLWTRWLEVALSLPPHALTDRAATVVPLLAGVCALASPSNPPQSAPRVRLKVPPHFFGPTLMRREGVGLQVPQLDNTKIPRAVGEIARVWYRKHTCVRAGPGEATPHLLTATSWRCVCPTGMWSGCPQ